MDILENINLKKIRKEKGLTQEKLVELSGISRGYISLLENKKRENITLNILMILSNSLNLCCKDLSLCDCKYNCDMKNKKEILLKINLKEIRMEKELTQKEMSKITGISRSYISLLESNPEINPTLNTINKLTETLDISFKDIIVCECNNNCKKPK